jgi:hypothetical protein
VREIERRVQMASKADMSRLDIPDAPVGIPNDLSEHFKLMFDLMALAFQADITRVITFSMDREASMRTYTNLGIAEAYVALGVYQVIPPREARARAEEAIARAVALTPDLAATSYLRAQLKLYLRSDWPTAPADLMESLRRDPNDALANVVPDLKAAPFGYPTPRDAVEPGWGNKAISLKLCRNVIIRDVSILHGGHFAILATGVDKRLELNIGFSTRGFSHRHFCCSSLGLKAQHFFSVSKKRSKYIK